MISESWFNKVYRTWWGEMYISRTNSAVFYYGTLINILIGTIFKSAPMQ